MEKKSLILIIVCIIVFSFVSLTYAGIIKQEQSVHVGDINFKLPEGYKYIGVNKQGYQRASNGLDTISFESYKDDNVSQHIKDYEKYCKSKNMTLNMSNFTTNNILVYKGVTNTNSTHYWFVYDDKTYTVFSSKEAFRIDDVAHYLIDSSISNH